MREKFGKLQIFLTEVNAHFWGRRQFKELYPLHKKVDYVEKSPPWSVLIRRPGVNFINILRTNFLYERRFGSFFLVTFT